MLLASSCGTTADKAYTPRYRFADGGCYRVDAEFDFKHKLVKKHKGKVFSDNRDGLHVKSTFALQTKTNDEGMVEARYILQHISVHDQAGKFRMELGPEQGQIYWYGQEETLEDYLGAGGVDKYRASIVRPLAVVRITPLGVQLHENDDNPGQAQFNYDLLHILGKNRVIGQIMVRSFKIPPVLMTIFKQEAVRPGQKWLYQGPYNQSITEWDKPLTTVFKLKTAAEDRLIVTFQSEMNFTGEELTQLGKTIGLSELEKVHFQSSEFTVAGEVSYAVSQGRPSSGSMQIEKDYGLTTARETWQLTERENYTFRVTPMPQAR